MDADAFDAVSSRLPWLAAIVALSRAIFTQESLDWMAWRTASISRELRQAERAPVRKACKVRSARRPTQPRLGMRPFDANVLDQLAARHVFADAVADLYVNNSHQLEGKWPPGRFICGRCRC